VEVEDRIAALDWWHTIEVAGTERRAGDGAAGLAGWAVEETTPVLRDRLGSAIGPRDLALASRLQHRLGLRGRSVAVLAHPLTP
jgi:hypothetical protein